MTIRQTSAIIQGDSFSNDAMTEIKLEAIIAMGRTGGILLIKGEIHSTRASLFPGIFISF